MQSRTAKQARIRIGCAGWAVPRAVAEHFPQEGSGLQRYAARFNAAEINSTFYRFHKAATYERWRDTTPDDFMFAVKAPRAMTHDAKLRDCAHLIAPFVDEVEEGLGAKLGPLLVQLPPSLAFDAAVAGEFFAAFRERWNGALVCEPRHVTWFEPEAEALLAAHHVARAGADPARHPNAGEPGGWRGLSYWRLHGSPRMYYSSYEDDYLASLADNVREADDEAWVIFDNTTSGAAAANGLTLRGMLS
jgi:uncharacterized protein YecE (DUF72 family)